MSVINIMFAVGPNGEFGRTAELTNHLLEQVEGDDLRNFPKNGLPWNCPSDMAFFRTATLGIDAATRCSAYSDLRKAFDRSPDSVRAILAGCWSGTSELNTVMSGSNTFDNMPIYSTPTRVSVPISKEFSERLADGTVSGLINYAANYTEGTVWIVGGKQIIETVMADHAAGKIKIDNMFISCVKSSGKSDVVFDCMKLAAYIDSNFTYNTEEAIENNDVLIVRYRGINK